MDFHRGLCGLGVVLRNERGELLLAISKGIHGHFSVKATEVYAAIMGLQALYNAGFHLDHIILEMDAQAIVYDLLSDDLDRSSEEDGP